MIFFTSNIFHTINLVKNLNICEYFLCLTDLFSGLCQMAYFLMWLINAFWFFFFLQCFIFFKDLTETLLPKKIILACSCLWVLFIYCWLLVLFRSGDPLRISSLIRKKTELWFTEPVGMSTAWFYWKWNSGTGLSVKHHFYKIWANILAVYGVLIGWVNSFVVQLNHCRVDEVYHTLGSGWEYTRS